MRASVSIPAAFKPHEIHYKDADQVRYKKHYTEGGAPKFVDGGVLKNSPIDAFDSIEYQKPSLGEKEWNRKIYNHRTLALCLRTESEGPEAKPPQGTKDVAIAIANLYFNAEAIITQSDPENKKRIIEIPIKGVGLLDFDLKDEQKKALVQAGREAVSTAFKRERGVVLNPAVQKTTNLFKERLHPDFIGRESLFKKIHTSFIPHADTQIRVLFGLPGMGKTQIALNYADQNRHNFSQVWAIDCRTEAVRDRDYRTVAEKMGLKPGHEKDIEIIRQSVHRYLEDHPDQKPWLLILDNVDKNLDPSKDWPQRGGQVLVTTAKNNIWNTRDYLPEVGAFTPTEAHQLLAKITQEKESPAMHKLASGLGYYPLALTLAAHYIGKEGTITVAEYAKAYEKFPMQAKMEPDAFYHHTLQNVWELTFQKINEFP